MRLKDFVFFGSLVGSAMLVYGCVGESNHPVLEEHTLLLPLWPESLDGYRIAVLGDLHVRDRWSMATARRAVEMAVAQCPDMVVLVGDFVSYWKEGAGELLAEALEPLREMDGMVVAVPGNHDYYYTGASPEMLRPIFEELGIKLLRNEVLRHGGIQWAGIDSRYKGCDDPFGTICQLGDGPAIVLWHEPDGVDELPPIASLQLSGHSHGGQFRFPGGFTPMSTKHGRKYVRGFHPEAPIPIFVTRGVGTTGPPSRFLCPPEVALLTLRPL